MWSTHERMTDNFDNTWIILINAEFNFIKGLLTDMTAFEKPKRSILDRKIFNHWSILHSLAFKALKQFLPVAYLCCKRTVYKRIRPKDLGLSPYQSAHIKVSTKTKVSQHWILSIIFILFLCLWHYFFSIIFYYCAKLVISVPYPW